MNAAGLERDIFGGSDSELSEDDDIVRNNIRQQSTGSDDNYGRDHVGQSSPKKRSSRTSEGAKLPKKRRKRRESQAVEEAGVELDPDQQRRLALSQQIDAIVKPNKFRPKKRKKHDTEDILDRFADEEIARLKHEMTMAVEIDRQANKERRPATAKLRMLNEVMDTMQKQGLQQSIFDNNLLQAVREWLEPSPVDKSLPALNIQNAFFEVLPKLDIDSNILKDSGLGKVILFYTLSKRVTPTIKRIAETLVDVWSRPIIKRSASYKDRSIPMAEHSTAPTKSANVIEIQESAKLAEKGRVRKNIAMIPERDFANYTVAPSSQMPTSGPAAIAAQAEIERRRAAADRMRKMTRKLALNKQKNSRL